MECSPSPTLCPDRIEKQRIHRNLARSLIIASIRDRPYQATTAYHFSNVGSTSSSGTTRDDSTLRCQIPSSFGFTHCIALRKTSARPFQLPLQKAKPGLNTGFNIEPHHASTHGSPLSRTRGDSPVGSYPTFTTLLVVWWANTPSHMARR